MRHFKILTVTLGAALWVAACGGGGGDGNQAPAIKLTSLVSFGDSLSDVGTYKVGTVAALGGGTYSVNGVTGTVGANPTPTKNWTELVAAQIGQSAPCPAQTGLDGDATKGFSVSAVNHAGCFNYAQGGARVTNPVGPGNKLLGGANATLGQLTVPIVTQIANHLAAVGGKFSGNELVTIMAGGNDVLALLDKLKADATAAGQAEGARVGALTFGNTLVGLLAAGATNPATAAQAIGLALQTESARTGSTSTTIVGAAVTAAATQPGNAAVGSPAVYGPMVATAQAAATAAGNTAGAKAGADYAASNGPALVAATAQAGAELAGYIKALIVGKGAKYVAVVNLPDVSLTPSAKAQDTQTQALISNMVIYFNKQLQDGLAGTAGVSLVDAYADNRNQIANPGQYALSNVTATACNLTTPSPNALGSSLVCNTSNLNAGDVSHYLFADSVHPTPYGYKLLAQLTTKSLVLAGWL